MNPEVTAYIEKQKSPQKEICVKLRKIIFKTFPKIKEQMKWGVPTYADGNYYIVALKDSVNLGFAIKGMSPQEVERFDLASIHPLPNHILLRQRVKIFLFSNYRLSSGLLQRFPETFGCLG